MTFPRSFSPATAFRKSERGAVTVMNIFLVVVLAIFSGIAIDISNLISSRTQLQVAADAAAHAALYTREKNGVDDSKSKAIEIAEFSMPTGLYGDVLRTANIHFGTYDKATRVFTIDETSREAVYVETDRLSANANAVSSFLLQFIGFWDWDVVTTSVFETYRPTCLREGFVAQDIVDIQSNNGFYNGFCIHSNTHVEVNNNNYYEAGTIVSMPDTDEIVLPNSGWEHNEGLESALRYGRYRIRILSRLDEIRDNVNNPNSDHYRTFLTNNMVINQSLTANNNQINAASYSQGRMYNITCTKPNGKLSMDAGPWRSIVIRTNCPIVFANNTVIENSTIITENTSNDSWKSPQGLRLGVDDDCADGGGTQLLSYGGVSTASSMEIYGSQIISAGDMDFSANASGIQGASIISGGKIDGTSNMQMSFCGSGMDNIFGVDYFRMAG
jgi:Flp pilus assembly protein TadG